MRALAIIALLLAACSSGPHELRDAGRLGRVELFRPSGEGPPDDLVFQVIGRELAVQDRDRTREQQEPRIGAIAASRRSFVSLSRCVPREQLREEPPCMFCSGSPPASRSA